MPIGEHNCWEELCLLGFLPRVRVYHKPQTLPWVQYFLWEPEIIHMPMNDSPIWQFLIGSHLPSHGDHPVLQLDGLYSFLSKDFQLVAICKTCSISCRLIVLSKGKFYQNSLWLVCLTGHVSCSCSRVQVSERKPFDTFWYNYIDVLGFCATEVFNYTKKCTVSTQFTNFGL